MAIQAHAVARTNELQKSTFYAMRWGGRRDLNPRQPDPQSGALTKLSYGHHPIKSIFSSLPPNPKTPWYHIWYHICPNPPCPRTNRHLKSLPHEKQTPVPAAPRRLQ